MIFVGGANNLLSKTVVEIYAFLKKKKNLIESELLFILQFL